MVVTFKTAVVAIAKVQVRSLVAIRRKPTVASVVDDNIIDYGVVEMEGADFPTFSKIFFDRFKRII